MRLVVDTSAIVAIALQEDLATAVSTTLSRFDVREMSVASYVEAGTVLAFRRRTNPADTLVELARLLDEAGVALVPVDAEQARLALDARIRFGKGFGHPAQLNYGDSFTYALAKLRGAPLLFVGEDFVHTDLTAAL